MRHGGTAALPTPWVKPTREGLRIEIPTRFDTFIRALLGAWLVFWAAGVAVIALGWLGVIAAPVPAAPLWFGFLAAFGAAGIFVAWHLSWVLWGREIVELKDGVFSISRGIGLWTGRARRYPWRGVSGLRTGSFERRVVYPSWGREFVGHDYAYLTFKSEGRDHQFGRGLTMEEAEEILELLRDKPSGEST